MPPQKMLHTISGKIVRAETKTGLDDVMVSLKGSDHIITTTTNPDGDYSLSGLRAGAYWVIPSKLGYTFKPPDQAIIIRDEDYGIADFIAILS